MTQTKLDNSNISIHLGKTSQYKSLYDASLLVREPRSNNRKHLEINDGDLPFVGFDTWNAYEVSGLMNSGMPVTGVAKIIYPCSSKYIVESKSLKLYFNSFNMTKLGSNAKQVLESIASKAIEDLSKLLETDVHVKIFSNQEIIDECGISVYHEYYKNFKTLEDEHGDKIEQISVYQETPELLKLIDSSPGIKFYHSALLKSNCRVTSQPDWGDVFITYEPESHDVDEKSLLEYIISFRDECHFHEEICETIYKRLYDKIKPKQLNVMCLYARRGGIDINPERSSHESLLHGVLSNDEFFHIKTPKQ